MKELQWTFRNRTGWPDGPWNLEPDKAQWVDEATGLPCMIHRNRFGAWCGYVGIGPDHPFYNKPCDDPDIDLSVHGGLNYADGCDPDFDPATGQGICHIPEPGEPDNVWWFGFDCSHAFDLAPGLNALLHPLRLSEISDHRTPEGLFPPLTPQGFFECEVYRDIEYVRAECAQLAIQLFFQRSTL